MDYTKLAAKLGYWVQYKPYSAKNIKQDNWEIGKKGSLEAFTKFYNVDNLIAFLKDMERSVS